MTAPEPQPEPEPLPGGHLAAGANGSIKSSIEQSRMSSSAISTFRLSRSGTLDHQPVDLAGRQPDPALCERLDQAGGGEHATVGHDLPPIPPPPPTRPLPRRRPSALLV